MRIGEIAQYNYFIGRNLYNQKISFAKNKDLPDEKLEEYNDLRVFNHHIYEYKKGLRNLILTTEKAKYRDVIEEKLQHNGISYIIHDIKGDKINVYFGADPCIEVVKTFSPKLNKLTPEQDFILGIMLGYDRVKQCERYLKTKNKVIKLSYPQE